MNALVSYKTQLEMMKWSGAKALEFLIKKGEALEQWQEQLSRLMQLGEQRQKALLEEQVCAHASRRKRPRRTYLPVHACVRA